MPLNRILSSQQKHDLWINSQIRNHILTPPVVFVDPGSGDRALVYSRDEAGEGRVLALSAEHGSMRHDKVYVDGIVASMNIDPGETASRFMFQRLQEERADGKVWTDDHTWIMADRFFREMCRARAPRFAAVEGTGNAARIFHDHLRCVARWGRANDYWGEKDPANIFLLQPGQTEWEETWEVIWEGGPQAWADFAHISMPRMFDDFLDCPGIRLMDTLQGPDWYCETNWSFSLVFVPR